MSNREVLLQSLVEAITECDVEKTRQLTIETLRAGLSPIDIMEDGLSKGARMVGELFAEGKAFLPDLMMAGQAMKAGVEVLRPKISRQSLKRSSLGRIVIGTVRGDLHDIGKNIVVMMLEAAGFEIFDLGVDVPAGKFIEKAVETDAHAIGASALLSSTLPEQRKIVEPLKRSGRAERIKVIIGGAAVTPKWAQELGAEYAENATEAVERVREMLHI